MVTFALALRARISSSRQRKAEITAPALAAPLDDTIGSSKLLKTMRLRIFNAHAPRVRKAAPESNTIVPHDYKNYRHGGKRKGRVHAEGACLTKKSWAVRPAPLNAMRTARSMPKSHSAAMP